MSSLAGGILRPCQLYLHAELPAPPLSVLHARHNHDELPAMAVWQWYKGIAPKTRILIGIGAMAYAGVGLYLSDKAEEKFGLVPTEQDKEELRKAIPRITTVERGDRQ